MCHIGVDEGFINISTYDYKVDKIDFDKGFWCDDYLGHLAIPVNWVDTLSTHNRIKEQFKDFFRN